MDLLLGLLFVVPLGLFAASAVSQASRNKLYAQYKDAFDRGDTQECERLRELMRAGLPDSVLNRLSEKVGEGEMFLLHERWAEARDVLAKVNRSMLPAKSRPGVLSNLAYATAQAGDPDQAIFLVEQALDEAAQQGGSYPAEKLPFLRGTRGVSLHLAGRHDDAIAVLEPLLEVRHPPRARATRAFYLGQSYRALGRFADAANAYDVAAGAEGPFADRARAAARTLHPHRG